MNYLKIVAVFLAVLALISCRTIVFTPPVQAGNFFRESLSGELDMRVYYDSIRGNEELSFKEDGVNYLSDVYFYYNKMVGMDDNIALNGQLYLRATDDRRFQTRNDRVRVENLYLTAERNGFWHLTGGYFSENYSSLTMNTTQLGLKGNYRLREDLTLSAFGGRDRRARSDQYRRTSIGGQVNWLESDRTEWKLNIVRTRDHKSSADIEDLARSNEVISMATRREELDGMLSFRGEIASSRVEEGDTEHSGKHAYRANLNLSPTDALRAGYRFERTDELFESFTASSRQDRILHRSNLDYNPQFLNLERFGFNFMGQRDIDEVTKGDERDRRSLRGGLDYRGAPGDWLTDFSLANERYWDEAQSADLDERLNEIELYLDLGWSDLMLASTYEDQHGEAERARAHQAVLFWDYHLLGIPINLETGIEYRKDREEDGGENIYNRRSVIEQHATLGRGDARLGLDYRYDYDRRGGGGGDVVQEEIETRFDYFLDRDFERILSLRFEWFDNRDKADSQRDYSEYTYELRFRSQF